MARLAIEVHRMPCVQESETSKSNRTTSYFLDMYNEICQMFSILFFNENKTRSWTIRRE